MPKRLLQCPFCSKKSTRGAGLASHIRSAHPDQHAVQAAPKATPSVPLKPSVAHAPTVRTTPEKAPNAGGGSPTVNLLSKAYEQLSERRRAIEAELGRFDNLRKELETTDLQIESLKKTLGVFESSPQPVSADAPLEPADMQEQQSGPAQVAVPKAPAAEFTGNKRELVTSIVESRGMAGVTPKEIAAIFAARKIVKGRNLIYNALSLSVKGGRMRRKDGKYFPVTGTDSSRSKRSRTGEKAV